MQTVVNGSFSDESRKLSVKFRTGKLDARSEEILASLTGRGGWGIQPIPGPASCEDWSWSCFVFMRYFAFTVSRLFLCS